MNNDNVFAELMLIHTELLMIEKVLLQYFYGPGDYEKTLDERIEAQKDLMNLLLDKLTGNGEDTNGHSL